MLSSHITYRLDPLNSDYLSELYRLRVIIPTQWPTISLSTLYGFRYLDRTRLGTERLLRLYPFQDYNLQQRFYSDETN